MNINDILVSVIMMTYNDEEFVLQTLESVKSQTYRNIELIISDDCSKDNTVSICRGWIEKNRERFAEVQLLTTEVNKGVTANCIRALKASHGEWIKHIGGDNLMEINAIERFVDYVSLNCQTKVLQCRLKKIDTQGVVIGDRVKGPDPVFHDDRTSAIQQMQLFYWLDPVDALGLFINASLLKERNYYDEDFRNQEDTPLTFNLLKAGHKIWFIDEPLVKRRMRAGSLSGLSDKLIISKNVIERVHINDKYFIPNLTRIERFIFLYYSFVANIFYRTFFNRKTVINNILWRLIRYPNSGYSKYKISSIKKNIVCSWS